MNKRSSTFTKNDKGEIIETVPGPWSDFDFDFSRAPIFYPLNAITIEKGNFSSAKFYSNADFSWATFTQNADFSKAAFAQTADFSWAAFTQNAGFSGAAFTQKMCISDSLHAVRGFWWGAVRRRRHVQPGVVYCATEDEL